jgi:hypothetical protein
MILRYTYHKLLGDKWDQVPKGNMVPWSKWAKVPKVNLISSQFGYNQFIWGNSFLVRYLFCIWIELVAAFNWLLLFNVCPYLEGTLCILISFSRKEKRF